MGSGDDIEEGSFPIALIIIDLFKNMFPDNIIKSMIFQTKSERTESELLETNVDATNNLGLVILSITLGFALRATPNTSGGVVSFLEGLTNAFTKIIGWVINFGPVGIL